MNRLLPTKLFLSVTDGCFVGNLLIEGVISMINMKIGEYVVLYEMHNLVSEKKPNSLKDIGLFLKGYFRKRPML